MVPTIKVLTLSDTWTPLSTGRLIQRCTIALPAANTVNMDIRVDGGTAAQWFPGVTADLGTIGLSRVEVKASEAESVLIIGAPESRRR